MADLSVRNRGENNPMYGRHHTDKAKDKIRQARLGTKASPRSEEYRQYVSKLHKGKIVSEETKKKLSNAHKGMTSPRKGVRLSEETKQKLREVNLGKSLTLETRKKISESGKGRKAWNKGKILGPWPNQSALTSGSGNPNWKGGISYERYTKEWDDDLKDSIRKRDDYVCQECGINQDELSGYLKRIDIHHIDYNKNNLDPRNLISLCRRCHIRTNYNRDSWTEYFNKTYERKQHAKHPYPGQE